MSLAARPLADTTQKAIAVLAKELGIVETVRFLSQFSTGFGDYTSERDTLFRGLTMDEMLSEIRRTPRRRPNTYQASGCQEAKRSRHGARGERRVKKARSVRR
jgi:hypothetical protein